MKYSIIVTAWKEAKTISRVVERLIIDIRLLSVDYEIVLICPDRETYEVAAEVIAKYEEGNNFTYIKDPQKGKPYALNMYLSQAKGDVLILTDGDVYIKKGSLKSLLEPFRNDLVGAVTGRPVNTGKRNTFWGYSGHMFTDAAHKKRMETLLNNEFFFVSGYLFAIRNFRQEINTDMLDDIAFSYMVFEKGLKIKYAPKAIVYINQPSNLKDWVAQKARSLAGHINMNLEKKMPNPRKFSDNLAYFFVPISYAKSLRELFWSLLNYPLRLYVWAYAFVNKVIKDKKVTQDGMWVRTESTK